MIREPHYFDDHSEMDTEVDLICEQLGVGPGLARRIKDYKDAAVAESVDWEIARILSIVLSDLVKPCKNLRARVYGLIFATGLDEVNSIHSQAEIARKIGCTRALISHYTTYWADLIKLGVFKFRKSEESRKTFKDSAIRTTVDRKLWAWAKGNSL
jgi:hypothetical protein